MNNRISLFRPILKSFIRPFFIAIQFLTRIPTPQMDNISEKEIGHSLLFYPLVGFIIGLLLVAIAWSTNGVSSFLSAALLLTVWVLITGALHIDGLADSADAWIGGNGDKERTLKIMKDPSSGPVAVTIVILILLLKLTAIESIISTGDILLLILAPIMARAYMPLLLLNTPYVRNNGLASAIINNLPSVRHIYGISYLVALFVCITGFYFFGIGGTTIIIISLAVFILARKLMQKRIDGTTGDTAGAMLEVIETVTLITIAILLSK